MRLFCACQAPLKLNNVDEFFRCFEIFAGIGKKLAFIKKITFSKSNLTINIMTLVNLEPIFGVMLEIKSIPNYLHGHTVSTVRFIWLIYWNKFGKKECELEV